MIISKTPHRMLALQQYGNWYHLTEERPITTKDKIHQTILFTVEEWKIISAAIALKEAL